VKPIARPAFFCPGRQRVDPRTHLLGDTRALVNSARQTIEAEKLLHDRVALLEGVAQVLGQQLGHHEVPEKQLHEQRNVAKDFDVGGGEAGQPLVRNRPQDADDGAKASAINQADSDRAMVTLKP
jgi:hypothetical protein